jgi:hypothetical protein
VLVHAPRGHDKITTKPGCWNRFKSLFSKWFFTNVSPGIADFISELTEFDEQQLEQQDCSDIAIEELKQHDEIMMTTTDGELNPEKQQEYTDIAINEPERPDESTGDFISELIEFDEQQMAQQEQPHDYEQLEKLEQRGYSIERDDRGEQKLEEQDQPHDYEQPEKLEQRGYSIECDHRGEQKLEQRISTNDCATMAG